MQPIKKRTKDSIVSRGVQFITASAFVMIPPWEGALWMPLLTWLLTFMVHPSHPYQPIANNKAAVMAERIALINQPTKSIHLPTCSTSRTAKRSDQLSADLADLSIRRSGPLASHQAVRTVYHVSAERQAQSLGARFYYAATDES